MRLQESAESLGLERGPGIWKKNPPTSKELQAEYPSFAAKFAMQDPKPYRRIYYDTSVYAG